MKNLEEFKKLSLEDKEKVMIETFGKYNIQSFYNKMAKIIYPPDGKA